MKKNNSANKFVKFYLNLVLLFVVISSAKASVEEENLNIDEEDFFAIKIKPNFQSDVFLVAKNQNHSASEKFFLNGEKNRNYQDYQALNSSRLNIKFERDLLNQKINKFSDRKKIVGFDVKLESENSANQDKHFISLDQGYFYFHDSDFISIEAGDVVSVSEKMKAGSVNFIKGGGGVSGNYLKFLTIPTDSEFILLPQTPTSHAGKALSGSYLNKNQIRVVRNQNLNGLADSSKINLYSPRINNFKAAISYTDDTSKSIFSNSVFNDSLSYQNVYNLAINYVSNYQNIDYAISASNERGRIKKNFINDEVYNDLNAYEVSATIAFFGFSLGSTYGNWGKTALKKNENYSDSRYFSNAISYQIASFSIALSDYKSSFKDNDLKVNAVSIDYKINKNFTPFMQLSKYQFLGSENSNFTKNKGYIFLTGFSANF